MKHLSPRLPVRVSGRTSFALLAVGIAASVAAFSSCTGGAEHCPDCTLNAEGGTFGGRAGTGGTAASGAAGTGAVGGTNVSGTAGTGSMAGSGGHGGVAITGNAGSTGVAGTGGMTGGPGRGGSDGGASGSGGSNPGHGGAGGTGGSGATGGSVGGAAGGGAGAGGRGGAAGSATAGAGGSGRGGMGGAGGAGLPAMVAYYPFESSLNDMSGNGKNGSMKGTVTFGTGHIGHDLDINNMATGATNYVALPANLLSNARAMTVAFWVRVRTDRAYARVFDFGANNQSYMYFTPHETSTGNSHFGISISSNTGEQSLATAAMKLATWYHVAITLGPNGGVLYVNGTQSAASTTITLRPMSLGATPNDWLGHSQWASDPYFDGEIDELRIYGDALTADQVRSLYMLN